MRPGRASLDCGCKVKRFRVCLKCARCGCDHDGHSVQEKLARSNGRPRKTMFEFLGLCKWVIDAPCAELTGDAISTKDWMDKIDKKYEEWRNIVDTKSFLARYVRELMRVLEGVSEGRSEERV